MDDLARLPIQSVQGAREQAHPQNAIGIPVDRLHPAGRETVGIGWPVPEMDELLLPEIQGVQPRTFGSHPQHAAAVLIDREDGVAVEAMRVGCIVLEPVREAFCAPVEIGETLARRHP